VCPIFFLLVPSVWLLVWKALIASNQHSYVKMGTLLSLTFILLIFGVLVKSEK
jgi:hypothetical protein